MPNTVVSFILHTLTKLKKYETHCIHLNIYNVNYSGMLLGLQIEDSPRQLRQSRRIAQLKIKEQAGIRLNQAQYQESKLTEFVKCDC